MSVRNGPAWMALARDLTQLQDELAGQGLSIDQAVAKCQTLIDFADHDRWQAISKLQHDYEKILAQHGLQNKNNARFCAIEEKMWITANWREYCSLTMRVMRMVA